MANEIRSAPQGRGFTLQSNCLVRLDLRLYNGYMLTNEDKQWILETLAEKLEEQRRDLGEKIEKVETTLLTEFHKWASPLEMRQRSHAAAIRALDAEVEALGDRVNKIEGH